MVTAGGAVWDLSPPTPRKGRDKPWSDHSEVCGSSLGEGVMRSREGRLNKVTPEFMSPLQPLLFCPGCVCSSISYTFHHWSTEKQQSSTSLFLNILRRYENGGILPGSVFPACQALLGKLWFLPIQQPSLVVRSMGWMYNQRQLATSLYLSFLICKVGAMVATS